MLQLGVCLMMVMAHQLALASAQAQTPFFANGAFVRSPDLDLTADEAMEMLSQRSGALKEAVSHWSGYYSINPEVTVALVEFMALESEQEIHDVLRTLFERFYERIQMPDYTDVAAEATFVDYFGSVEEFSKFHSAYTKLFRNTNHSGLRLLTLPFERLLAKGPPDDMVLPFELGKSWYFNGVHKWTGRDDRSPMSAIDMTPSWNLKWGDDTSSAVVTSAHSGLVEVYSPCELTIKHHDQYETVYSNLDRIQVTTGQYIDARTPLGVVSNGEGQGLCNSRGDSQESGPRVQIGFLRQGFYMDLNDAYFSGYRVNSGKFPFDKSSDMYLERNSQRYRAYEDSVENDSKPPPRTPYPRPSRDPIGPIWSRVIDLLNFFGFDL